MPPTAAQATTGPITKVPCPWCSKHNNFTSHDHLVGEQMQSQGDGDPGDEATFYCDHCNGKMKIVAVQRVIFVTVRQVA